VSTRTQPPPDERVARTAPSGYHLEWQAEGSDWKLATDEESREKKCRRPGCQREPVAALMRSRWGSARNESRGVWWFYCDWHLYGRRLNKGRIEFLRTVPNEDAQ